MRISMIKSGPGDRSEVYSLWEITSQLLNQIRYQQISPAAPTSSYLLNGSDNTEERKRESSEAQQETDLRENLLYQSFKHLWNNRQLKTIYFLFQELDYLESKTGEDGVDSQKKAYIQSIETILDMKENVVTHFITRVTTVL